MRELASARPRYGYRRIHTLLRREGWKDGLNRVHRLYNLEGLHVRIEESRAEIRIPRPLPRVSCDRIQISEVFHNLISNALKYSFQLKFGASVFRSFTRIR